MPTWTEPDFVEILVNSECTAYAGGSQQLDQPENDTVLRRNLERDDALPADRPCSKM